MNKLAQKNQSLKTRPALLLLFLDALIALAASRSFGRQLSSYEIADYASSIKMLFIFVFCMLGYVKAKNNNMDGKPYLFFACVFAIYPVFELGNFHILIDFKIHEFFHWDRSQDKITRRVNDLIGLTFFIPITIIGLKLIKKIPGYNTNKPFLKIGLSIFIFSLILDLMTTSPSIFEILIKDRGLSFTLGTIISIVEEILEVFCLNYFLLFFYYSLKEKSKKKVSARKAAN